MYPRRRCHWTVNKPVKTGVYLLAWQSYGRVKTARIISGKYLSPRHVLLASVQARLVTKLESAPAPDYRRLRHRKNQYSSAFSHTGYSLLLLPLFASISRRKTVKNISKDDIARFCVSSLLFQPSAGNYQRDTMGFFDNHDQLSRLSRTMARTRRSEMATRRKTASCKENTVAILLTVAVLV